MASGINETIETASLGRPFQLGMLYDCRTETLIPDTTLWSTKTVTESRQVKSQINTESQVFVTDSNKHNVSALKVNSSLKASLLAGLVEVGGAAKYFNDRTKSNNQVRVTLKYYTTTRYEQLNMTDLAKRKVSSPRVFKEGTATHVVTAVLYGAEAYCVFGREVSAEENKKDVEGELKLALDELKYDTIKTVFSVKRNREGKSTVKNFSCIFYGDLQMSENPFTFDEAIKVYSKLPQLLGKDGEKAVPVKAWLYPLAKLNSNAARLIRQISDSCVQYFQRAIEKLDEVEIKCNDLLNDPVAKTLPLFKGHIQTLKEVTDQYKVFFSKQIADILPSIRGGQREEEDIKDVLSQNDGSPFNPQRINQWIKKKETNMNTVRGFLTTLQTSEIEIMSPEKIEQERSNPNVEMVVCFTFTSLHPPEPYLLDLVITGGKVEYKTQKKANWESLAVTGIEDTVTVSGLQPNTEYELRSTAQGKLGYTEYISPLLQNRLACCRCSTVLITVLDVSETCCKACNSYRKKN
ncbi:stonustoxin subunit alpha [Amia ocellicauda]|uniref:stonustoxin subunit alpha n=1 Tax=Amia ocellicauda TaxID=2972642 RepID=UPI0034639611